MNGIVGILRLDGAPVATAQLTAMASALAAYGPGGCVTWADGPIGLGCALLPATPEAAHERMPLHAEPAGLSIVAGARLDNRAELCAALGIGAAERPTTPDTTLLMRAYQRWGEGCAEHLLGDWHAAIWDAQARRLLLARDPHGISALYYARGPGFLAFASTIGALLALPELPRRPHMLRLAQILTAWQGDGVATAYEGILRLPPAHTLGVADGVIQPRRYWDLGQVTPLALPSDADYIEQFLELYRQAVRVRLRASGPIGATLSGGLDSGSVAALAAEQLSSTGARLTAFTATPRHDPRAALGRGYIGDESALATATARHAGAIDHIAIDAAAVSPLAGIERMLALHNEPGHAASNAFWLVALLDAARAHGVQVLLTGQAGNAGVSWSGMAPPPLWPLLRGGRMGALRDLLVRLYRDEGLAPWAIVRRHLLWPLLYPARRRALAGQPAWQTYAALRPAFAAAIGLDAAMAGGGHDPSFAPRADPRAQRLGILRPGATIIGALWHQNGAGHALEARDPTMDTRLLQFCLAVPEPVFRREGHDRALIRRAMRGLLPDAVRLNRRRGLQSADIAWRLLAQPAELRAILARLEAHPLARDMLDLARMAATLADIERAVTPQSSAAARTILLRGIGVGLFLLRF